MKTKAPHKIGEIMNKMEIKITSGMGGDGFFITIKNEKEILFMNSFDYGYNASWEKGWSDDKQPYTSDIIIDLIEKYSIAKENISVVPGVYIFNGEQMEEKEVRDFKDNYMKEVYSVYES
ncbi:MAG: hypothetical protein ACOC1K_05320, partial [Nanoarchaeota archaeon]